MGFNHQTWRYKNSQKLGHLGMIPLANHHSRIQPNIILVGCTVVDMITIDHLIVVLTCFDGLADGRSILLCH